MPICASRANSRHGWKKLPGQGGQFVPSQLTTTAVERYLSALKEQGDSVSHRTRVNTVLNGFCSGSFYLGHVTIKGMPAIRTTVRYTQVSHAQVKEKLKLLKG